MSSAFSQPPEKRISAQFTHQAEIDETLQRLLHRGVPKENIVIVRNFQSETRIVGFLDKTDRVKALSLKGAIHGLVLGAALTAIAETDTFLLPLLGRVSTGSVGAILLGAVGGALLISLSIGLGATLLIPELSEVDRPAIYQTQTRPGTLSLVVGAPTEKSGEISLLLQSAGGNDILTT